jgi:hypothetical protein
MKPRISQAEAHAFRARWQLANTAEREELRTTPIAHKLRQLAALMASARMLGETTDHGEEEAEIRSRWNRLRRAERASG